MRLETVHETHGQTTHCIRCGRRILLDGCTADLDGPAFRAYYCRDCARAHATAQERKA